MPQSAMPHGATAPALPPPAATGNRYLLVLDMDLPAADEQLGLEPGNTTPEEFSKFVQDETSRANALVKARNIKVD